MASVDPITLQPTNRPGLENLLNAIGQAALRFLGQLFQAEVQIVSNIERIVNDYEQTKSNLATEIQKLKDFNFDPKWKTRVVNVPIAVEQIQKFITAFADEFRDRLGTLVAPIHDLQRIFHAEAQPDPMGAPAGVTKAAVKVDEISTMISQVADAMDVLKEWSDFFLQLTDDIQSLEQIFLQQGNSRSRLASKPFVRIGKLHGKA